MFRTGDKYPDMGPLKSNPGVVRFNIFDGKGVFTIFQEKRIKENMGSIHEENVAVKLGASKGMPLLFLYVAGFWFAVEYVPFVDKEIFGKSILKVECMKFSVAVVGEDRIVEDMRYYELSHHFTKLFYEIVEVADAAMTEQDFINELIHIQSYTSSQLLSMYALYEDIPKEISEEEFYVDEVEMEYPDQTSHASELAEVFDAFEKFEKESERLFGFIDADEE